MPLEINPVASIAPAVVMFPPATLPVAVIVVTAVIELPAAIVLVAFNAVVTFPDGAKVVIVMPAAWKSAKPASVTVVPSPIPVVVPAWNSSADSFHIKTALAESPRSPTKPKSYAATPVWSLPSNSIGSSIIVLTVSSVVLAPTTFKFPVIVRLLA